MNSNTKLFDEFPPVTTQQWEEKIQEDLKGADYEKKLIWKTYEGINIKPYYRAEDTQNLDYQQAQPGDYPYIRGYNAETNAWNIREEIIVKDNSEANKAALAAIAAGATDISFKIKDLAFKEELAKLLKGINLEEIPIHFASSHSYSILADLLIDYVHKTGIDKHKVRGSFNFDSIAYFLLHGEYYNSCNDNFNEAAALIRTVQHNLPSFKALNMNGQHYYNSGATAVQELAYTLSSANEFMANLTDRGISADDICKNMQLTFGIGSNYFIEIAKLRAARMLWARIAEQYHPSAPDALKITINTVSGMWNKSIYDPYVNVLRLTTECMSASIGGANSICLLPFNNTYKKPDEFSTRIARNVQIVLKEESYLDKVVDPAAGSYYIESLTDEIAQMSWNQFKKIEEVGGICAVMENGNLKNDIEQVASLRNMDIAMRKTPILGTNIFPNQHEKMLPEVNHTLHVYDEPYLRPYRGAEAFENIRMATEKYVQSGNSCPKVFIATYGSLAMRKARATFAVNFLACAGYEILEEYLSDNIDITMKEIINSKANMVVICSSDDEYAQYAPDLASAIKKSSANIQVLIAGYPKDSLETLKTAGVDDFIHMRVNIIEALTKFQSQFGIK